MGTCYTYRKAATFHNPHTIKTLHVPEDDPIPDDLEATTDMFLRKEYFVSYDPHTYFIYAAAMLGCIPIVHPVGNLTKREWVYSGFAGSYARHSRSDVLIDSVAYGWEEVETARKNIHLVRDDLYEVKRWGNATVQRFIHDAHVHATSGHNYKGRLLVKDLYPPRWYENGRSLIEHTV